MTIDCNPALVAAWQQFLTHDENFGHADRAITGDTIADHIAACLHGARLYQRRVVHDTGIQASSGQPRHILDVGSSTGMSAFVFAEAFPTADIKGIEPEQEAIAVANAMQQTAPLYQHISFQQGFAEHLPYSDQSFDLVICRTVIEHVRSPAQVIAEINRVLKPGGVLHIEAPNYLWPHEPHINIFFIPYLGKFAMKMAACLQGKKRRASFLDHLQLITPFQLESYFRANNMDFTNIYYSKVNDVLNGDIKNIEAYHRLGKFLAAMGRVRFLRWLLLLPLVCGVYPSVIYTARRRA